MTALVPEIGIQIQNDSGQVIPPRSVIVVTSVEMVQTGPGQETVAIHHAQQYACGVAGNVFVTGPQAIPATSSDSSAFPGPRALGVAYADQFLYVSIDPNITPPVSGEEWGPADGTWTVTRGGVGFSAQGYSFTGASPDRSMFLRTFKRAAPTKCSSSSSSGPSSGSSGSSGSSTSSGPCQCVVVVTSVFCTSTGGLQVGYGLAGGCCGTGENT